MDISAALSCKMAQFCNYGFKYKQILVYPKFSGQISYQIYIKWYGYEIWVRTDMILKMRAIASN